jgi:hypothetical protein
MQVDSRKACRQIRKGKLFKQTGGVTLDAEGRKKQSEEEAGCSSLEGRKS